MKIILLLLVTTTIYAIPKYNRKEYKQWVDEDKDGLNTRMEVLIEENIGKLVLSNNRVISGLWYDYFTDQYFTKASDLSIDHFIPLKEAHLSGSWKWSLEKKEQFANYLENTNHLIAVSFRVNSSKGAKTPCDWMPPNKKYYQTYINNWEELKKEWGLEISTKEKFCIIQRRIQIWFYDLGQHIITLIKNALD